jgi:flagellar L-ring protein precursor FlgH
MRRPVLMVLLCAAIPLGACGSIKEAVHGPTLSKPGNPAPLTPTTQEGLSQAISNRDPLPQAASPNSLWRTGARAFFHDQRASKVGDILTVLIEIDDSAKTTNATNASLTTANAMGVPNFFGLESTLGRVMPKAFDPAKAISTNTSSTSAGAGGIDRQEQISLTIAAVVTQVLPNGNLAIQGRQEVKTNNDTRILTVEGIVRPEDITSANTILHTQIAEARINYGGKGDIAAVQKTPAGTGLLQRFFPF